MTEIILFLTYFYLIFAQRLPTISRVSQEQIRDIGSSVDLVCFVQYVRDYYYPVLWIKTDRDRLTESIVISSGTGLIIPDSRFRIIYDDRLCSYTLSIVDIQETDSGLYECQITIDANLRIKAAVRLSVRIPPLIFDNSTRSLLVVEGESIKFECYAGGYPKPDIYWRKQNNEPLPMKKAVYKANVMNVTSVRKEDRGTYYCVADNGVGRGARRNVALQVQFAPIVTATRKRVGQAVHRDTDLECRVEAYPPPAIVWLKDGVSSLANNRHYDISHLVASDEITYTIMRVINIEKSRYGWYVCKAINTFGESEIRIELFETIVAICPPSCAGINTRT